MVERSEFHGTVGRTFAGGEPWWPPRAEAPEGAPNVVIVMVDDLGYSDLACFGSELRTPHVDRLAAEGLRYTNFHVTPMCSPTRASLLTGLNPHLAGVGHVAHSDSGYPGYAMELRPDVSTMPEVFRSAGYATFMVGKWHLSKDSDQSAAGPRHSWPCQRGFDRYYGVLDAFTNLHHPHRLVRDNSPVEIEEYPEGYYFTDDITDRAIDMVTELRASHPHQPFLLYVAHGAVHAPLHARAEDIEANRGRFDEGWDALRERRYRRQIKLGIVDPETRLAPRNAELNNDVQAWDDLPAGERALFARYQEVFAAMVERIDHNVGRLVDTLDRLGELDNTVFLFTSDNGSSREGELVGTTAYYVHLLMGDDIDADRARLDEIGGPTTTPHMPRGWAMLGNTPFRLYKINTHAGGHTAPLVVRWPAGLGERRGELRHQYTHVTQVLATLCELAGIDTPDDVMSGRSGRSAAATLYDGAAPSGHDEQVYETQGHRGLYRDGWEIVSLHQPMTPFGDHEWELYHLADDRTELDNRAEAEPDRLAAMAARWEELAAENQIYPLDEGTGLKYLVRPLRSAAYSEPVTILAGTPTLERWRSVQLIWFRGATYRVRLGDGGYSPGDRGVLFAHGDQGGGYLVHIDDGRVHYVHNDGRGRLRHLDGGPVPSGAREVVCRTVAPGGGSWTVALEVAGEPRGEIEGVPLLYGMAPFEGLSVGRDPRSPVVWELFERFGANRYSGALDRVTIEPGEPAPDAPVNLMGLLRDIGLRFE